MILYKVAPPILPVASASEKDFYQFSKCPVDVESNWSQRETEAWVKRESNIYIYMSYKHIL